MSEAEELNAAGTEHVKRGELAEALALYERALALDPSLAKAENNRGNVLKRLGRVRDAEAAFHKAHAGGSDKALPNLAALLAEDGRIADVAGLLANASSAVAAAAWSAVARVTSGFVRDAAELHAARAAGGPSPAVLRPFGGGLVCALPRTVTITHHVLAEREDWFEDEIHFVRAFLRPGEGAVDVGANFGVYAMSMARAVGPSGRVLAVEPAWATRTFLEETLAQNGAAHVTVVAAALSSEPGTATFFNANSPELSGLEAAGVEGGTREVVRVITLDEATRDLATPAVFMKLDAEGEETRILDGASAFLSAHDPLVMTELVHGRTVNEGLLQKLRALGHDLYYLAPGLGLLQPLDEARVRQGFLLNVFACSPTRRAEVVARGLLAERTSALTPTASEAAAVAVRRAALCPAGSPGRGLSNALDLLLLGGVASSPSARLEAGWRALEAATLEAGLTRSLASLMFVARAATTVGQRALAVQASLDALATIDALAPDADVPPDLAVGPSVRFDDEPIRTTLRAWATASVLDHLLHEKAYAAIFDPSLVELAKRAALGPHPQPLATRILASHR